MPSTRYEQVKHSVECRGKNVGDMNKTELLDMLYEDIHLEKKVCLVLPVLSRVFVRSRLPNMVHNSSYGGGLSQA